MRKKIITLTMVSMLALAMTACGDKKQEDTTETTTEATTTEATTEEVTEATVSDAEEAVEEEETNYVFGRNYEDAEKIADKVMYVSENDGAKFGAVYGAIKEGYEAAPSPESYADENGNRYTFALMNGEAVVEDVNSARDIYNIIEISVWKGHDSFDEWVGEESGYVIMDDYVDDANRTWSVHHNNFQDMTYYYIKAENDMVYTILLKDFRFDYDISKIINSKSIITE